MGQGLKEMSFKSKVTIHVRKRVNIKKTFNVVSLENCP